MSQILHGACILVGNQSKENFNLYTVQAIHSNVGRLGNLGGGGICPRLQGVTSSIATALFLSGDCHNIVLLKFLLNKNIHELPLITLRFLVFQNYIYGLLIELKIIKLNYQMLSFSQGKVLHILKTGLSEALAR